MCVCLSLLVCDILSVQSAGPEILVPGSDGNLQEVCQLAQDLHTLSASIFTLSHHASVICVTSAETPIEIRAGCLLWCCTPVILLAAQPCS